MKKKINTKNLLIFFSGFATNFFLILLVTMGLNIGGIFVPYTITATLITCGTLIYLARKMKLKAEINIGGNE